jgi:hypothetical protein
VNSFHKALEILVKNWNNCLQFVLHCTYMILPCFNVIKSCEMKDWFFSLSGIAFVKKVVQRVCYLPTFCLNVVFSTILPHCFENPFKYMQLFGCNIHQVFCLSVCHLSNRKQLLLSWMIRSRCFHHFINCKGLVTLLWLMKYFLHHFVNLY